MSQATTGAGTILDSITAHKRVEVAARKVARPLSSLLCMLGGATPARDFAAALVDPTRHAPRVIAEIKRRSPSKGVLRERIDPAEVARTYEANGAAALSVLADERFFGGSLADLSAARQAVTLPVLCKEFIVDEYQLYEARLAGADAVLLIAAALAGEKLRDFREIAEQLGMQALVEVHDVAELASALSSGARTVGINNRDLRTFELSLETTRTLLPLVPEGLVTVAESGIKSRADREVMAGLGVSAILVGEGLIASSNIAAATRAICGLDPHEQKGTVS